MKTPDRITFDLHVHYEAEGRSNASSSTLSGRLSVEEYVKLRTLAIMWDMGLTDALAQCISIASTEAE